MDNVIVFGAGNLFLRFMMLKERYWPELKISCVCDNNVNLDGYSVLGIPVISADKIAENVEKYNAKTVLIVAGRMAGYSIFEQLHSLNLPTEIYGLNEKAFYSLLNDKNSRGGVEVSILQQ